MVEIERKWRLRNFPTQFKIGNRTHILQGYIVTSPGELRLRQVGTYYYLTVKSETGIQREEWEHKIPEWVFTSLWSNIKGKIVKDRATFIWGKYVLEVDTYQGGLEGLIILECEFPDLEEAERFSLPIYLSDAVEVTGDIKYSNKYLAMNGMPILEK